MMNDNEILTYAENLMTFLGEDNTLTPEGEQYVTNNSIDPTDQTRVMQLVEDMINARKAATASTQETATEESDSGETASCEAEAPLEAEVASTGEGSAA